MENIVKISPVPIWHKYSLSIEEAAQYYGIGVKRLRSLVSDAAWREPQSAGAQRA